MKLNRLVLFGIALVAAPAMASTTQTGYVRYLGVLPDGSISIQLSQTVGGTALDLCTSGATTYSEGKVQGSVTMDGIKGWLMVLMSAKLAGIKVAVQSNNNGSNACSAVSLYVCSVSAGC